MCSATNCKSRAPQLRANAANLANGGGAGYMPGDQLQVQGGAPVGGLNTNRVVLEVTSVIPAGMPNAGQVTGFSVINPGNYTVLPANPVATTDLTRATGAGAIFSLVPNQAVLQVTSVNNGQVTGVRVINPGSYTVLPGPGATVLDITPFRVGMGATFNLAPSTDTLIVNDRNALVGRTYNLSPAALNSNTLTWSPVPGTIAFSNLGFIILNAGNVHNFINLMALNGVGQNGASATFNAGSGNDTIVVSAVKAGGQAIVNAAATPNSLAMLGMTTTTLVFVSSDLFSANINGILGEVPVHGNSGDPNVSVAGKTILYILDQDTAAAAYTVTDNNVARTGLAGTITYDNVNQLTLSTSATATTTVLSTSKGTTTYIYGGSAVDIGDANNTLDGVLGDLFVSGTGCTLTVNDQGGAADTLYDTFNSPILSDDDFLYVERPRFQP